MKLFTIGFTKTTAHGFFSRIKDAGVERILDVRLNNVSQLSGFAKRDDLKYFAAELCGADYEHLRELAPEKSILDEYKKNKGSWEKYEEKFHALMVKRRIEDFDRGKFDNGCLLCSEDKPHNCHRRLVAEYLQQYWDNLEVIHL